MLVKMGIFPKVRGEIKKYLSCHHLVLHLLSFWLNIELTSGCASHWRYLFSTYTTVISIIYPFFRFKVSPRHTRLKSRKTRKARIIRSKPKGPGRGTWNTSWKMGRTPKPRFFVCKKTRLLTQKRHLCHELKSSNFFGLSNTWRFLFQQHRNLH